MYDLRLHICQSTTNQSENIPWRESLGTQWGIDQGAHDSSIRSFGSQGLRQWRTDWLRGANECRMMWLTVLFDIYIYLCYIHILYVFFVEKLHKHIHVCVFGLKFLSTFEYFPVYSSMILSHFSYQSFYQLPVAWNRGAFGVPKWTFERLSCVFTYFLYCGTGIAAMAKGVCIEVSGK